MEELAPGLPTKAVVDWSGTSRGQIKRFAKGHGFAAFVEDGPKLNQEGGIVYADKEIDYQFISAPSTASTAWMVIAIKQLQGVPNAQLFFSNPATSPKLDR